jgi:hypothetical protein
MPVKKAADAQPNFLLKQARLASGRSQKEVADLVEAPYTFMVTRWENGTAFPGPGYRRKLCDLFQKELAQLGFQKSSAALEHLRSPTFIFDPAIPPQLVGAFSLVGRDDSLLQLTKKLCSTEKLSPLALHGLPGVGKTALLSALAHSAPMQEHFREGILWAALGPRPNLPMLLNRWGKLLGIDESKQTSLNSQDAWIDALRQAVGLRRLLLIYDDVWSIEDAFTCKIDGPNCIHLLTTRIPEIAIRFAGVQTMIVPELNPSESIELLTRLAPTIAEIESDLLHSLVQAVGGLPLALTLIGNYLLLQTRHYHHRRIQVALAWLQRSEARLQLQQPQRDPRLSVGTPVTLQAVIGISEAMLTETARRALFALSVFPPKPSTFSEAAALALSSFSADTLDHLVDMGLIEYSPPERYMLHQTIADYARSKYQEAGEIERMINYFMDYVETNQAKYDLLDLELTNILVAFQRGFERGIKRTVEQVVGFGVFLLRRGFYILADDFFLRATQAARTLGENYRLAQIFYIWGATLIEQGDLSQGEQRCQEGLALACWSAEPDLIS